MLATSALGVLVVALVALAIARNTYRSAPMRRFFEGRPDAPLLNRVDSTGRVGVKPGPAG